MVSYLTGQGYFGSCWVGKRLSPCIGRSERTPPYASSSMANGSYLFLEASIAPATFAAAKFGVRSSGHNHGRFPPLLPYTVPPMMIVHSKTTTSHCIIHTIFAWLLTTLGLLSPIIDNPIKIASMRSPQHLASPVSSPRYHSWATYESRL